MDDIEMILLDLKNAIAQSESDGKDIAQAFQVAINQIGYNWIDEEGQEYARFLQSRQSQLLRLDLGRCNILKKMLLIGTKCQEIHSNIPEVPKDPPQKSLKKTM